MINDSLIILAAGLSSRMKKSVSVNNLSKNSIEQANNRTYAAQLVLKKILENV